VSDTTITTTEGTARPAVGGVHSWLVFVGHFGEAGVPSSSHALDEIDEIRFCRGARGVERRRGVLELALPDARMSTEHGRWLRRGAGWMIEDRSSKNGTIVDGVLERSAPLRDGAVIELGHSCFVFRQAHVEAVPLHLAGDVDARGLPAWPPGLATFSPRLARTYDGLIRLAPSLASILLTGETGVGKEVVARAVHGSSGRAGELVAVNCGALPAALVESELFGHRRGAFSGAVSERRGLVRSADGGTLFLDEIGELPPAAQAALLRVLQEREVLPVGEDRPIAVDLRVIAATLRDLDAAVADGRFRPDLYGRVAGHVVALPPLRERREDLGLLLAAMLGKRRPIRLAPAVLRALLRHDWPRNVRELEQALSTAIDLASGDAIELEHLPAALRGGAAAPQPAPAPAAAPALDDDDRELRTRLVQLLAEHGGNVRVVAKQLGKERAQIYKWAKRLRIDLDAFRRPG
jgi:sigma-54 dependent transcriptional regulator, acetoin dehydrogenase operon transcriptional activator AcoR